MEIRPNHAHKSQQAQGPQGKGPTRELLTDSLLVTGAVRDLFVDTIPANDKAAKMQRSMSDRKITARETKGRGAHSTVMSATRFFNSKTNSYMTLVAPRLRSS